MHDAKNRPLKAGDLVLITATVTELHQGEDYCNVSVRSAIGRRPDRDYDTLSALDTGVLLRANPGDENDVTAWATTSGKWQG